MKTTLYFTLTLIAFVTLAFVPNSFAQSVSAEYVVRTIYFHPSDILPHENSISTLRSLVDSTKQFYADEMARHGFGSKTFTTETNSSGETLVHTVTGNSINAEYVSGTAGSITDEVGSEFNLSMNVIYLIWIGVDYGEPPDGNYDTLSVGGWGYGNSFSGSAEVGSRILHIADDISHVYDRAVVGIAHELGHTFGLLHDFRDDYYIMSYGNPIYKDQLSYCSAKWLDVSRYFNSSQTSSDPFTTTINMSPPILVSAPNTIRFRFQVTDSDGLHQAVLLSEFTDGIGVLDCKSLNGNTTTVEFDTTEIGTRNTYVSLRVIDVQGNFTGQTFSINISTLLTDTGNVQIPDANLAISIRQNLNLASNATITQQDMRELKTFTAKGASGFIDDPIGTPITDLTGLEHAINLEFINISNHSVSSLSPLSGLTRLKTLIAGNNEINDISSLTGLTQLSLLSLGYNQITDIRPLLGLANLHTLDLQNNPITDRTPLQTLQSNNPRLKIYIEAVTVVKQAPVFTEGSSTSRSVFEGTAAGANIGSPITATDADNDTLTYSLSGTDAGPFVINTGTGQLKTKVGVELDFETKFAYTVTVTATDTQGNTDTITVNINIQDVNETADNNPPIFGDGSTTSRSIDENAVVGANIGSPITATDPDNDTLTYSLSGTDAGSFVINTGTGQLKTKVGVELDFETKQRYIVIVTATDGEGLTAIITVNISIQDVDETAPNNPPVFGDGSSATRSVLENTEAGVNIGSPITATDADNDALTYSLSGTDASAFDIDTGTGQLKTKATLDYDTKNTYTVEVSVSDDKGGSASITVTINVTQAGEDLPIDDTTETETTITPGDYTIIAGQISFSELMFATKGGLHSLAQWMELYNNSDTNAVNLTGWKLEIEARDKNGTHRHSVIPLEALHIPANQTALIVTWNAQRKSEGFSEDLVYNFFNHHSDEFEQDTHRNMVLGFEGFFLKLAAPDGTVSDVIGNIDGDPATSDEPLWEIPSGTTENGVRASIMRRYVMDTHTPLDGTALDNWASTSKFPLLITRYWGSSTDIGNPGYRGGGAVPVTLSHFRAEHTDAGVVLKWTTESEVDNAGFNILRSHSKNGTFKVVNPTMIQGAGTTGERNEYTWTDTTAKPNTVYYYQIEDVSHAGVRKQLATVRLRGLITASGKRTTSWADLKVQN